MGEVLDLTSFYNIFEKNSFNWETFNDIALTLAVKCQNADYSDKLDLREAIRILKILQSNFKNNSGITSALEVDNSIHKIRLMRLVVDTTAYYLSMQGCTIDSRFYFTMETTKKTGIKNSLERYEDDIDKCLHLLSLLDNSANEVLDCFKYIESTLKELSSLNNSLITKFDFSDVYLPSNFNSYGYSVARDETKALRRVERDKKEKAYLDTFYFSFINNVFRIYFKESNTTEMALSMRKLYRLSISSYTPIYIGGWYNDLPALELPNFFKQSSAVVRMSTSSFTDACPISDDSIKKALAFLKTELSM